MSKKVDERVVEMRFDNKQFESGVKDTMSTLDKFKQKLQLKDATKGLDNLEKAAKKVDFSNITKSANAVGDDVSKLTKEMKSAFGSFENFAYDAGFRVRDIWLKVGNVLEYQVAGRIIDIGKNLAKAFTIDPILTGFQEYETQINAVQTILANTESKGSTLQDVNAALNELNKYADMTIYNFTEMTRNIGTFTAAGVDLKTSVSAIKGIANLAAVSGSTSLQASTAMYQLSQALAAGKVQLMDWNSVVNAGMGGQVFQDALKETARVHNIAIDDMIKKEGSFRETLQHGWLTAEILTETLSKFTGDLSAEQLKQMGYTEEQIAGIIKMGKTANDAATKVKTFTQLFDTLKEAAQSGWTRSWEILIGDFGEAKEFLTSISDSLSEIINKSADARNSLLSGGLSSGWKQLLNEGIADEEGYKETLKSVVSTHGTSIDEMIKAEQKLDESLTDTEAFQKVLKKGIAEGTITADMFTESVHKMADKMSNMSAEQLEAAGYTKDHVEQIKALSDGLKDGSVSMDEFVKKMSRSSGRENLIEALWNSFDALLSVIKPIKEAFREIFPATTGEQLYSLTERIRDFTATLKLSDEQAANLKATFKGVFSVINIGVTIIKSIVSGIATLIGKITGLNGGLLEITGALGTWISDMAKGINETNLFGKAINKIVGFLGLAIDKFKEFAGAIKEKVSAPGFEWFFNLMKGIWDIVQKIGSKVGEVASKIGGALAEAFRNGDIKSLLDILNGGLFATILLGIKKYISGITDKFDDAVGIVDKIKAVLGSVEESLKSWQQNLQSGTIKNIAIAIGILAASLWVISGIDSNKLASALGGIGVLMGELMGAMYLFTKVTADAKSALKGIPALIGIAAAVLILASALKKLSDLSWEQLAVGLTGVLGLMTVLVGAAKIMSTNGKKIKMGAMQMVIMAAALKILASVCADLSKLSWNGLAKGVSGITAMLLAFVGFQALMKKVEPKKMLSSAMSLILIGAAMKIFADVCAEFGKMEWPDLGKAGAAIAGILVIATGFGKLSSYTGKMVSSSIALVIIGAAMEIFADVANKFGQMEWEQLGKAGAAIGGILALASGFVLLSGLASDMMKSVITLTIMAAAMEIFADVANKFGQMEWEQLGKAGAAIGGILALAAGFALLAGLSSGMLTSAAALLVMAAALAVFTPVMMALGSMSWGSIIKGLVAIAAAFAIVGVAGALLGPLVPAILGVSGAIALLGIACLAAGAGIMMFAAGFTALAAAGAAGAASFVAAITVIIIGILELIPRIVDELTAAVVAICNVIIQSAPAIGEAIKAIILTLVDVLVECVPAITEGFLQLLIGVMKALVQYGPQVIDLLVDFILVVINGITARLPELMTAVANLIVTFINGLAEHVPEFVAAGINLFGAIIQGIADAIGPILEILSNAISKVIESIAKALPGVALVIMAIGNVIGTVLNGIATIITSVGDTIRNVLEGIASVVESVGDSIRNSLDGLAGVFDSAFGGIADVINSVGDTIEKFLNGIANIIDSVGEAALNAGTGFEKLANGIAIITNLKLADMAASLAAVGAGLGKIVTESVGISDVGLAMEQIASGTMLAKNAFDSIASGISTITSSFVSVSESAKSVTTDMIATFINAKGPIVSAISEMLSACISTMNSSYSQFYSAGSYLVDGFCNGITVNTFKAIAAARAMAKAAYDAAKAELDVNSSSKKFMTIGKFVATGLAKGITKNVGTANKASVKMANGVLASTQEALGIHSPSVVFDEKVGRYIVQGIAEGIKKDMSAEEAAEKKAQNIVNAFQKAFDKIKLKRSNREKAAKLWGLTGGKGASAVDTLKYDQQKLNDDLWDLTQEAKLAEDKWILLRDTFGEESKYAQEAYGEWLDIQIEAAETGTKLSEATKSFVDIQNELMQDLKTINENDLKIFELMQKNGKVYSNAEIDDKNLTTLRNNLNAMETVRNNAYKEYERIGGQYADSNDENVRNAKKAWQEAEIAVQEANLEIREYEQSIADRMIEGIDNQISFREDFIKQWEARNKYASTKQKNMFYTNMYDMEATDKWVKLKWLEKDHEDLVKRIAKDNNISIEEARKTREATKNYYEKVFPAQTDYLEANNKLKDKRNEIFDQEIQNIEDDKSNREELKRRWEATYGRDASDEERYQFEWQMATANIKERKKTFGVYTKEYVQLIKDVAKEKNLTLEEAAQTEQATEFKNKYLIPAENDALEAENERHDLKMDRLEQEKENRKTEYETASDIADLKYQIWELTAGREAKDEEKETMKLAVLAEQLGNQAKLVDMARNKWKSAKSEDKLKYEKEYWDARLELANLQSDVLDIQESITKRQERALDRQRKAQDDYDNYLKKYEQYYLDHGMTLEELEKDARLVSGYDPDKVITTAANKTNTAIENVRNNVANLTKAVGEGIQNGISDVTDNTSSMLDACAKTLNEEKDTWFKAGASMVDGLTEGITSKMQTAVDTVTELITKMLAAIQDVASNGMNYTASVTPVLDTSSIYDQASRTGKMVSDRQLKLVQAIRQGVDYSRANSSASAKAQSTDPTYTFVQNNYSPKALSSLDIYRQTNNMMSRIGKKVNQ